MKKKNSVLKSKIKRKKEEEPEDSDEQESEEEEEEVKRPAKKKPKTASEVLESWKDPETGEVNWSKEFDSWSAPQLVSHILAQRRQISEHEATALELNTSIHLLENKITKMKVERKTMRDEISSLIKSSTDVQIQLAKFDAERTIYKDLYSQLKK
jgi:hypothetical protein